MSAMVTSIQGINWSEWFRRTDLIFAFGLIMVMSILIMPMPRALMDICLAMSITFAVLIFMTSLLITRPLDFSTFPTILLVSTMIRLALNVATTRLILSHGHEGLHAAGHVIEAFGQWVMGGNFVIGLIVFAILEIVNFVVITKGSGRIAEVSARFTLDAMPGKQMAIDADLSSGLIGEDVARQRRRDLESESNFYGAMDGAAKFVRGDAIAGLLITFINIIGGVIIGVAHMGMSFGSAMTTYTILTVGDGLVSQIPALIVSLAAGLLVSKGGVEGSADQALFRQLSAHPAALGMCSFLLGCLSVLPGIPFFPFFLLSGVCAWGAWRLSQQNIAAALAEQAPQDQADGLTVLEEDPLQPMERIRLDLGYGILHLANEVMNGALPTHIRKLRHQFAQDLGFVIPTVRMQDNLSLGADDYVIYIKGTEAGRGALRTGHVLVMNPQNEIMSHVRGETTTDPIFGIPAMWVSSDQRDKLTGYTVVEPEIILTTHISEIIKDNVSDLLSYSDVQFMLSKLDDTYKKLLADIIPGQITTGTIQRILQNLISERVSIRDLPTILEGVAEGCAVSRNVSLITEYVRHRLARQIVYAHVDENGLLPYLSLSPEWEMEIADSLVGEGDYRQMALAPSRIQIFVQQTRQLFDQLGRQGETPVLITSSLLRPYVRSILERARPSTIILSQTELPAKIKLRSLGVL